MKTASLGLLEVMVVRVNAGGDAPRKQLTPNDKLRQSQDERTSIKKSIAYNIKDMKRLESNPDVIQYLKACKLVGSGHVQSYLSKYEESKKLDARLSDVENVIKVHKAAVSNLVTFAHENYQCPVHSSILVIIWIMKILTRLLKMGKYPQPSPL